MEKKKEGRGSHGGQKEEKEGRRKEAKEKLGRTEPYSRAPPPTKDLSGAKAFWCSVVVVVVVVAI